MNGWLSAKEGRLTKKVLESAIKAYNNTRGKLKVCGTKEDLCERLWDVVQWWFFWCFFVAFMCLEEGCPP